MTAERAALFRLTLLRYDVPVSSDLHHNIGPAGAGPAPSAAVLREPAAPRRELPSYAALDLGTNNCRLLIARRAGLPKPSAGVI